MTELLMTCSLATRPPAPVWPTGVRFGLFGEMESKDVHRLFSRAYKTSGLFNDDHPHWWSDLSRHPEFDPMLCFAVYTANGRALAAAQCWSSASINLLAVDPTVQRRGLGTQLVRQCLTAIWARSSPLLLVKLSAENSAAHRMFEKAGLTDIPPIGA